MSAKKVVSMVFILLIGATGLSAALTYSPASPRTGETVTFTLTPSGAQIGSISWNFGDGSPVQSGTSLTISHVYAAVGSYVAKASYAILANPLVTDQATVTVIDPRQISYSPPQPKAGQSITFTALNFYSACIRWDFGDGMVKNGSAGESHTYAIAGIYIVRAYEECGGTYGAAATVSVAEEVAPPPSQPSLTVSFVSLYFSGGRPEVSVGKDFAPLQAFADLQVAGSGLLQCQWLVDDVVIKSDTLAVSFGNKFTFDSGKVPGLPTSIPGQHRVTLRFQQPAVGFAIPAITYFVAVKGPAPVIRKVTPGLLAPGSEYKLDLEGAGLTPDTEISFPAPLAVVKRATILSETRAEVTVFVAPTAGPGVKEVTARNPYGQTNGPGQVRVVVIPKSPPDKTSPQASKVSILDSSIMDLLKKMPRINGWIDCYPYASPPFVDAVISLVKDDQPVTGAEVKVDGMLLTPGVPNPAYYSAKLNMDIPLGHQFTVSVSVDGNTYVGTGGKVDNIVQVIKPADGTTINPKLIQQIDVQWTYSSGIEPVYLHVEYEGPPYHQPILLETVAADHYVMPTSLIPGSVGRLGVFLSKEYAPVVFAGPAALTSSVHVFQSVFRPQKELILSDRKPPKVPSSSQAATVHDSSFQALLKNLPQIFGAIEIDSFVRHVPPYAFGCFLIGKEGKIVSDAIVKVDGILVPHAEEYPDNPGIYCGGMADEDIPVGHRFEVSVTVDGATYTGKSEPIDSIARMIMPKDGTTMSLSRTPVIKFDWFYSNGVFPVRLTVTFWGEGGSSITLFDQMVNADRAAVSTAAIPPGSKGTIQVGLMKEFSNVIMDGMVRFTSNITLGLGKNKNIWIHVID